MANRRLRSELAETARGLHKLAALDDKAMREIESLLIKGNSRSASPRVLQAPAPNVPAGTPLPPNRLVSVIVRPGEHVEWVWTSAPDGGSYVSGYTIKAVRAPRRRVRGR